MSDFENSRPPLSEETCQQFSALVLLHQVVTEPKAYHAALLESEDSLLEPVFDYMMKLDLVTVGENDYFQATEKGRDAYQNLLHQQQSYLMHYDVYAAVDLAEGVFGNPEKDNLEDPRWSDLRVAVAEYKKIDPYRMVFLSMLADGSFFENTDWKFDIVLGSSFFKDVEEIVLSQISVAELGYEDEDGTIISGESVIEDVILQGARVNKERLEQERQRQASLFDEEEEARRREEEEEEEDGIVYVPYDPWYPAGAYLGSALFVESLWLSSYW